MRESESKAQTHGMQCNATMVKVKIRLNLANPNGWGW